MSDDLVLLSDYLTNGWERCTAHQQGLACIRHPNHRTVDGAAIGPVQPTHGDPFLLPSQTNPTAGTPEDAAAQLDMARDLDRALKARDEDGEGE